MEKRSDSDDVWHLIAGLARTVANSADENVVWVHADAVFGAIIGHQLFTVLGCDEQAATVTRLYSNRPSEYPLGGTKPMRATPWGDQVLKRGQVFIAKDAADIEWAFPDHALIASMGLASAINLPIRVAGTTLGTVNLLHVAGFYHHSHVEVGTILAALLAPVLLKR